MSESNRLAEILCLSPPAQSITLAVYLYKELKVYNLTGV